VGRRGPKPKPAELESAQGFPGRRKRRTKTQIAAIEPPDDIQDEPADSRFVPPVPGHMSRRQRAHWAAVWSNPALATLLKTTDHGVIARWCQLTELAEWFRKKKPEPVYEEQRVTVDAEGHETVTTKLKRNPAFDQMLATMRELRAVEATLGFNPAARLNVDGKLGHKKPEGGAADEGRKKHAGAPAGPLGILKQPVRPN